MSWTDPDSPWRRAQLRRVRRARALVFVSALFDLIMVGVMAAIGARLARTIGTLGPDASAGWQIVRSPVAILGLGLFAGTMIASLALLVWLARRERRVLTAVPAAGGLLCPRCRRALDPDGAALRCPKGHAVGSAEAVREHWLGYPFDPQAAAGWRVDESSLGWRQRLRRRPWLVLPTMAVLWAVLIVAMMRLADESLLPAMVTTAWGILIPLAFYLWSLGRGRRVGDETLCARCGYEQTADSAGSCCPECGQRWLEAGGSVRGRLVRSPRLMWTGVAIGALVVVFMVGRFPTVANRLPPYVPTTVLVHWVGGSMSSNQASWAELARRRLTPAQQERLARGLIERRRHDRYVHQGAQAWMDAAIRAGTLPPDVDGQWRATQTP